MSEAPRFGHELLALVRPQGQCAPGAWPDGEFSDDHLVYPDDDAYDVYDEDIARACVTVYLIDGQGRIGPGVALQAPPAPAPPKPVLADVSLRLTEDAIRFHTTVDEDRFQLVAVVADSCLTWSEDPPHGPVNLGVVCPQSRSTAVSVFTRAPTGSQRRGQHR